MYIKKLAFFTLGFITLTTLLTGCSTPSETTSDDIIKIKLGVNGTDFRVWDYIRDELAKENIELEVISFADYIQPNLALDQGEIDINSFQTNIYFEQFKEEHNLDLTAIGNTVFAPMGVYSDKLSETTAIGEGGIVAIPNDPTNGGRALLLLEETGLIEVDDTAGLIPTLKDVTSNPKNLQIQDMAANQIPRSLPDVDLAVINNGVAADAGFKPLEDAIYMENPESENAYNYYNIFAVRTSDQDNPALKRLVEIYQTDEVKNILNEISGGATLPVF